MQLEVIILAAGQGTRMKSSLPKVLHPLAGRPLLEHVIATALSLNPTAVHTVIGHGAEQVKQRLGEFGEGVTVQCFSALKKTGLEDLKNKLDVVLEYLNES